MNSTSIVVSGGAVVAQLMPRPHPITACADRVSAVLARAEEQLVAPTRT
ncbi:hypothetical protein [Nocardioides antri]|nr:hypothetical protein [Nocardioides antri]